MNRYRIWTDRYLLFVFLIVPDMNSLTYFICFRNLLICLRNSSRRSDTYILPIPNRLSFSSEIIFFLRNEFTDSSEMHSFIPHLRNALSDSSEIRWFLRNAKCGFSCFFCYLSAFLRKWTEDWYKLQYLLYSRPYSKVYWTTSSYLPLVNWHIMTQWTPC